jgi:hypothetical protein
VGDAERLDELLARVGTLPPEAAVAETRLFFDGLGPDAATRLADERPDQVGELDGVPVALRYRANHLRLTRFRDELRAKVDSGAGSEHDRDRLGTLDEMLTPVTELGVDASGRPVQVQRDRQFLVVEPAADGQVVEVRGDLQSARNVAILVPGMDNDLESLRGEISRTEAIRTESGPDTAAIMWLGFDSPDGLVEAVSKKRAYDAAPLLRRFAAGLDTEIRPDARTTLIGHSYGCTVGGQAILHGARFDNVIFAGSPGIDPDVHRAADLGAPDTRYFALRAPGDIVAYTEWHGTDPAEFPDIVRMQSSVHGHNDYCRPNSESLRNIGRVVRGEYGAVTTTDTTRGQETRLAPGISWGPVLNGVTHPVAAAYDGVAALTGATPPPRAPAVQAGAGRTDGSRRPEGPVR